MRTDEASVFSIEIQGDLTKSKMAVNLNFSNVVNEGKGKENL